MVGKSFKCDMECGIKFFDVKPSKMKPVLWTESIPELVDIKPRKQSRPGLKSSEYISRQRIQSLQSFDVTNLIFDAFKSDPSNQSFQIISEAWMKSKICDGPFAVLFSSVLRNNLPVFHDKSHSIDWKNNYQGYSEYHIPEMVRSRNFGPRHVWNSACDLFLGYSFLLYSVTVWTARYRTSNEPIKSYKIVIRGSIYWPAHLAPRNCLSFLIGQQFLYNL